MCHIHSVQCAENAWGLYDDILEKEIEVVKMVAAAS